MSDNIVSQVRTMDGKLSTLWSDFYGDDRRHEPGLVQEFSGVTAAINRLTVVLVFFSLISLVNLIILIWIILSL